MLRRGLADGSRQAADLLGCPGDLSRLAFAYLVVRSKSHDPFSDYLYTDPKINGVWHSCSGHLTRSCLWHIDDLSGAWSRFKITVDCKEYKISSRTKKVLQVHPSIAAVQKGISSRLSELA